MSNIYIQEPPALGKVLLKTTAGDIDIELWTKEAPKACRNFIQLCMEGYYNDTIFHRVIPGFIAQGGDPNGDGTGGESIYGAPFKDEFHSRLRFNRRGLVAMANAGKDDNGSQFFITLGATPDLQNKHTIFGKVTGETIYNVLKLSEGLIGVDDRPEHPRRISGTEVLINPFTDIQPRVTRTVIEPTPSKKKRKDERKAVKNFALLSFGEEAEEDEGEAMEFRGKPKSTHDLLEDPKLSKLTAAELELEQDKPPTTEELEQIQHQSSATLSGIRDKLARKRDRDTEDTGGKETEDKEEYYIGKDRDDERKRERDRIRREIYELKREMRPKRGPSSSDVGREGDSTTGGPPGREGDSTILDDIRENEMYTQYVEEQTKYTQLKEKIPKKGVAREDFTLQLLAKFKSKLYAIKEKSEGEGTSAAADDDDVNGDKWLGHKLRFEDSAPVLAKDASTKGDDWFDIYDPRNPINKRKREKQDKKDYK